MWGEGGLNWLDDDDGDDGDDFLIITRRKNAIKF